MHIVGHDTASNSVPHRDQTGTNNASPFQARAARVRLSIHHLNVIGVWCVLLKLVLVELDKSFTFSQSRSVWASVCPLSELPQWVERPELLCSVYIRVCAGSHLSPVGTSMVGMMIQTFMFILPFLPFAFVLGLHSSAVSTSMVG